MAPALTSEATTCTRDKLPLSPPLAVSQETRVVSGQGHRLASDSQSRHHSLGLVDLSKKVLKKKLLDPDFGSSPGAAALTRKLTSLGIELNLPGPTDPAAPVSLAVATGILTSSATSGLIMSTGNGSDNQNNVGSRQLAEASSSTSASLKPSSMGIRSTGQTSPYGGTASQSCTANGINSLSHADTMVPGPPSSVDTVGVSTSIELPKDIKVTQEDATVATVARQKVLQSRAERLLKRLRRLQTRQAVSHTRQQMIGLVDYQRNTLNLKSNKPETEEKSSLLQDKDVKNLSTSALVNLIHSWQSQHAQTARRQQEVKEAQDAEAKVKLSDDFCVELDRVGGNLQTNLRHLQCAVDSDATESSSGGESCDDMDYDDWDGKTPRPKLKRRAEWRWSQERSQIASRWTWLQAQVSDLEYRIRQQNDIYRQIRQSKGMVSLGDVLQPEVPATASSAVSVKKANPVQQTIQQHEQKKDASPCNISAMLSNVDKQSSHLTQQLGNVYSPATSSTLKDSKGVPNGLVDTNIVGSNTVQASKDGQICNMFPPGHFVPGSPASDASCVAARCRPVKTYRIRKLLRTSGLHQASRKAAKHSTVRCGCYTPKPSCAMCGGRYNNYQHIQPHMSVQEKVALLDPAYHPVLSFVQDAPLALHFEGLLKTGEWQQQKPPSKAFAKMLQLEKKRKYNVKERPRKYNKRLTKSASAAMMNRIKNKYDQKGLSRSANFPGTPTKGTDGTNVSEAKPRVTLPHKVRKRKSGLMHQATDSSRKRPRIALGNRVSRTSSLSGFDSMKEKPESSTFKEMKDALRKRRGENAFDIDNIVIPYSIAASTRVEKPKYKEIATPKWREVTSEDTSSASTNVIKSDTKNDVSKESKAVPNSTSQSSEDKGIIMAPIPSDDEEDIGDDAYLMRHHRCEINEKKKFMSYMIAQRRGRGHRTDSNADGAADSPQQESSQASSASTSSLHASASTSSLASPLLQPQLSALASSAEDDGAILASYELARQRRSGSVFSSRNRSMSVCDERHLEDCPPPVAPWQPRKFPLCEDSFEKLLCEHPVHTSSRLELREHVVPSAAAGRPTSPAGSGGSETSSVADDPNDPEWTVDENSDQPPQQQSKLVLRLTKR